MSKSAIYTIEELRNLGKNISRMIGDLHDLADLLKFEAYSWLKEVGYADEKDYGACAEWLLGGINECLSDYEDWCSSDEQDSNEYDTKPYLITEELAGVGDKLVELFGTMFDHKNGMSIDYDKED